MNNTKIYLILASAMALPISALFGQNSGNVIVIPEIANRFASGQFFVGGGVGRSGGSQFQNIPGQAIPAPGASTTIEARRDSGKSDLIFGLNPATPQQRFLLQQQQQQQFGNAGNFGGTVGGSVGNGTGIPPMGTFGPGTSVPDPAVNAVPEPGVNAVPEPGVNAVPLPPAQFPGTTNNLNQQRMPNTGRLPTPIPVPGNPGFPIIPVPVPNGNNNQGGNTPGSATPGAVNPGPATPGTVNPGPAAPGAPNPGPRGNGSF